MFCGIRTCGDPGELGARQDGRMGTGSGGWGRTGDEIHVDIPREQVGDGTQRDKGQGAEGTAEIERGTQRKKNKTGTEEKNT